MRRKRMSRAPTVHEVQARSDMVEEQAPEKIRAICLKGRGPVP